MQVRAAFVCLILLLTCAAHGGDPPSREPQTVETATEAPGEATSYNMCPEDECDGGGGGGGYTGCYDCSSDGTNATCYPDGRYWADCEGGSICWYLAGGGWECEPYCGQRRCYSI